jgi:uncharacterized RDD family membrane protein YckC
MQTETLLTTREWQYAGLWPRLLALVVDFAMLSLVFFPVTRLVKGVWLMTAGDHAWGYGWFITDPLCVTFLIIIFLYFVLLEGTFGATIGKSMLGLWVITPEGGRAGIGRAVVRNLLRAVDALPAFNILGVILIATSRDKTRVGDRVAGTRVIVHNRKSSSR